MKRVAEFTSLGSSLRKDFWTECYKELGLGVDFEYLLLPSEEQLASSEDLPGLIAKNWREWTRDREAILIDDSLSEMFTHIIPGMPQRVLQSRKVDFMGRDIAHKWWPECIIRDQLHKAIVEKLPHLDCSRVAYITGPNFNMFVALAVASQLGFPRVNLVLEDIDFGTKILQEIQRIFFGVDIRILANEDLTLQKNDGSLLINTVSANVLPDLIQDLSYLNFILADSLVVDMSLFPLKNSLVDECNHVGIDLITGLQLTGYCDHEMLVKVFPDFKLDRSEYLQLWSAFLVRQGESSSEPKV